MDFKISSAVIAAACSMLGACATVTRGTHTQFAVQSEPPGAEAVTTTGFSCRATPCQMKLPRKEAFDVTVSKPGYKPQVVHVQSRVQAGGAAGFVGNAAIGGVLGAVIDASSGAMNDLVPSRVNVTLERDGRAEPAPPPQVAYAPPPVAHGPALAERALPPEEEAAPSASYSRPPGGYDRPAIGYAPPPELYRPHPTVPAQSWEEPDRRELAYSPPPQAYHPSPDRYVLPPRYRRAPAYQQAPAAECPPPARYGPAAEWRESPQARYRQPPQESDIVE